MLTISKALENMPKIGSDGKPNPSVQNIHCIANFIKKQYGDNALQEKSPRDIARRILEKHSARVSSTFSMVNTLYKNAEYEKNKNELSGPFTTKNNVVYCLKNDTETYALTRTIPDNKKINTAIKNTVTVEELPISNFLKAVEVARKRNPINEGHSSPPQGAEYHGLLTESAPQAARNGSPEEIEYNFAPVKLLDNTSAPNIHLQKLASLQPSNVLTNTIPCKRKLDPNPMQDEPNFCLPAFDALFSLDQRFSGQLHSNADVKQICGLNWQISNQAVPGASVPWGIYNNDKNDDLSPEECELSIQECDSGNAVLTMKQGDWQIKSHTTNSNSSSLRAAIGNEHFLATDNNLGKVYECGIPISLSKEGRISKFFSHDGSTQNFTPAVSPRFSKSGNSR